jgi:hypothetical protein
VEDDLMSRRSKRSFWVLLIVCLTVLACAMDLAPVFQYRCGYALMNSLVRPGMDIDVAANVLRANGFSVGQKYCPTQNRDYYWVDVRLVNRASRIADLLNTAGIRVRYYRYGCLESGLDGVVRRVF